MSKSTLRNENASAVSPADAGEATGGRERFAALLEDFQEHALTTPLEVVSFWVAVVLPFLYVPLLLSGISLQGELLTFVGLLAINVAAFLVGHGHKRN